MQTTFFFLFSVLLIERYEDFQNLFDFEIYKISSALFLME